MVQNPGERRDKGTEWSKTVALDFAILFFFYHPFTSPFFFTYIIKLKAKAFSPHNPLLAGGRKKKRETVPHASSDSVVAGLALCSISLFLTLQWHNSSSGLEHSEISTAPLTEAVACRNDGLCPLEARILPSQQPQAVFGSPQSLQFCCNKIMLFYNLVNSAKISPDTSPCLTFISCGTAGPDCSISHFQHFLPL